MPWGQTVESAEAGTPLPTRKYVEKVRRVLPRPLVGKGEESQHRDVPKPPGTMLRGCCEHPGRLQLGVPLRG